jgi:hypothetical protein
VMIGITTMIGIIMMNTGIMKGTTIATRQAMPRDLLAA